MLQKEMIVVYQAPVEEAEYQIRRKDSLGFYDCLKPRLRKVLRRKKKSIKDDPQIDDIAMLIEENDTLWADHQLIKEENHKLKVRVKYLENSHDVVDWYTNVLEKGVVTKDLYDDMVAT